MMRLTTIALFASIMCPLSVFAATTQKIVSTNIVLEEVANQNDKDLEDVTLLSGLLKAKVCFFFGNVTCFFEKLNCRLNLQYRKLPMISQA